MMASAGCLAEKALWWGGHDLRRTRAFFAQMREDLALEGKELGTTAEMAWGFLNHLVELDGGDHKGRPAGQKAGVAPAMGGELVYSEQTTDGLIEFYAISPWLGPQTAYTRWIDSQVLTTPTGITQLRPNKGVATCTSLAFLIKHGGAQVLLGGDMEADNWEHFKTARVKGPYQLILSPLALTRPDGRQEVAALEIRGMVRGRAVSRSVVQAVWRRASRSRKKGCDAGAMSVNSTIRFGLPSPPRGGCPKWDEGFALRGRRSPSRLPPKAQRGLSTAQVTGGKRRKKGVRLERLVQGGGAQREYCRGAYEDGGADGHKPAWNQVT